MGAMRRMLRAGGVALATVMLAGCATQPGADTAAGGGEWKTSQADVTGVRLSDDPHTVLLDVAVLLTGRVRGDATVVLGLAI